MITVFYDGACGLCRREMNHYRAIAGEGVFDWCDITERADALAGTGIAYVDALRLLHARTADGRMHIGVDAFIVMWRNLPRWRYLARFVALPGVRQMAQLVYRAFAHWRFKRLAHCQIAAREVGQ